MEIGIVQGKNTKKEKESDWNPNQSLENCYDIIAQSTFHSTFDDSDHQVRVVTLDLCDF